MSPIETLQLVTSLFGVLVGVSILVRVASGHEVIRSRPWQGVQLSPLLTRFSSAMFAVTFVAMAVVIFPGSTLQGPAGLVMASASAASLLLLVLAAVPRTASWGRQPPSDLSRSKTPSQTQSPPRRYRLIGPVSATRPEPLR